MNYKNSKFYVENISIGKLTRSFQTPFYCYSKSRLSQNIKNFNKNFEKTEPLICFSVKSNSNSKLLKIYAWYDNEWGFSNRMCDIAEYLRKIS